jgi:hypothetical protein
VLQLLYLRLLNVLRSNVETVVGYTAAVALAAATTAASTTTAATTTATYMCRNATPREMRCTALHL